MTPKTTITTLLMLRFGAGRIGCYLSETLPRVDVEALLEIIGGVHNLTELAERPYTHSGLSLGLTVKLPGSGRTPRAWRVRGPGRKVAP